MTIGYRNNAAERIVQALKNPDEMQAQTVALIAQAEATLALAEEQHTANLIAVYSMERTTNTDETKVVREDIADAALTAALKALGLNT